MVLDGHIHIMQSEEGREELPNRLKAANVDGGVLLSFPPKCFSDGIEPNRPFEQRLENVLWWAGVQENLFPFLWIDPTEDDALAQVGTAVERGISGFKIICNRHYPGDERAMPVYRAIADANRPILFHSGILWDGRFSSKYNRPVEFEAMLEVPGLRFALAHISWPWYDECLAVYGKFMVARSMWKHEPVEMFIDVTPGTPPIYREDAITKVFTLGYDINQNVLFGSDMLANEYNPEIVRQVIARDCEIYDGINLDETVTRAIFAENLKRFIVGA